MVSPLEYLTECGLTRYPFKDSSTLLGYDSTNIEQLISLPDNVILDVVFVINHITLDDSSLDYDAKRVTVSRIYKTRPIVDSLEPRFAIDFDVWDSDNTFLKRYTVFKDGQVTNFDTWYYSDVNNDIYVKVVVGEGLTTYNDIVDNNGDVSIPTALYEINFPGIDEAYPSESTTTTTTPAYLEPAAELISHVIYLPKPRVTSITFENFIEDEPNEVIAIYDEVFTIKPGTNIELHKEDNGIGLNVIPGAGEGLFDNCPTVDELTIKSINNIAPDINGNFSFFGDNCFKFTKNVSPDPIGLTLSHHCKPKCAEDQIRAYAFYVNRLKDAALTLQCYIEDIGAALVDQMDKYQKYLKSIEQTPAPYIDSVYIASKNTVKGFASFAVGVYNPIRTRIGDSKIYGNLSVTLASGSEYNYVAGTSNIREDNKTQPLPGLGFTNRSINCGSYLEHNFVISKIYNPTLASSTTTTPTGNFIEALNSRVQFLFEETGGARPAKAFRQEEIYPFELYFNVSWNKIWKQAPASTTTSTTTRSAHCSTASTTTSTTTPAQVSQYLYKFSIDIGDPSSVGSIYSTTVTINLPVGLSYKQGTLFSVLNNQKYAISNPSSSVISFTRNIHYGQKAEIIFEATSTLELNTTASISVATTSPAVTTTHTIPIK